MKSWKVITCFYCEGYESTEEVFTSHKAAMDFFNDTTQDPDDPYFEISYVCMYECYVENDRIRTGNRLMYKEF